MASSGVLKIVTLSILGFYPCKGFDWNISWARKWVRLEPTIYLFATNEYVALYQSREVDFVSDVVVVCGCCGLLWRLFQSGGRDCCGDVRAKGLFRVKTSMRSSIRKWRVLFVTRHSSNKQPHTHTHARTRLNSCHIYTCINLNMCAWVCVCVYT